MANSVDQNEAAHYELPHQDLHCLQTLLFSLLALETFDKAGALKQDLSVYRTAYLPLAHHIKKVLCKILKCDAHTHPFAYVKADIRLTTTAPCISYSPDNEKISTEVWSVCLPV